MSKTRAALGYPSLLALALIATLGTTPAQAAKRKPARAPAASSACTDFYSYANADWLKANRSGSALAQLRERTEQQQRDLLQAAMQSPQGQVQKLLGDFWASGLDEAAVEADGAKPIAPLLDRINAIKKSKDIAPAIAALHQVGIPVAFNFSPDIDLRALDRHIGYFVQGGLGLPDPAYYTRTDADTAQVMARYRNYVKQILALTGTPQNRLDADTQAVLDLETRLARAAKPLADLRDPFANFAPANVKDLGKQYRNLQIDAFLKAQGVNDDTVSLAEPALFKQIDALIASLKPEQWKAYLSWRVGDAMAPYLAKSFREAEFEFRGKVLHGETTPPPRWQQVLSAINLAAGPMLGKEYAERYLPKASDQQAEAIALQVRDALDRALQRTHWLSPDTQTEARNKLARLKIEVGTPHRDVDYSVQPMGRGSFGGNLLIASTWRHREEMKRIGKGNADRRWDVLPQQPALAYDLAQNRLIVTAAVLQPPVFYPSGEAAKQYGAYAALVGHELSRAVDNKGSLVNAKGDLKSWWSPTDLTAWNAITARVATQYNALAYPELKNVNVNGKQVQDEALADLAGVELAWDAFITAQPQAGTPAKQAFYQAWAHLWAQRFDAVQAAQRAASDLNAPGLWRTNVPLSNHPGFAQTFTCKPGQPMQRKEADQIALWR